MNKLVLQFLFLICFLIPALVQAKILKVYNNTGYTLHVWQTVDHNYCRDGSPSMMLAPGDSQQITTSYTCSHNFNTSKETMEVDLCIDEAACNNNVPLAYVGYYAKSFWSSGSDGWAQGSYHNALSWVGNFVDANNPGVPPTEGTAPWSALILAPSR